jgi:hypothetical protein
MSKGSQPRPLSVSDQEYADRWDAIFNRDKPSQGDSEQDKVTRNNSETQEVLLEYISP